MLITPFIQTLLHDLDHTHEASARDALLKTLVTTLHTACEACPPENAPLAPWQPGARYPIDADGYAVAFDPVTEEQAFVDHWQRYGMVVGKNVVPATLLDRVRARMRDVVLTLSYGACDLADPLTYGNIPTDGVGVPFISRGFLELYHDAILAEIRQSPRMYVHHVLLWRQAHLWTSFDRLGLKPPEHAESAGLPLHVDQNPTVHPGFKTVQGVLALDDCPLERGTFVGVPTSRALFPQYASAVVNKGEYVELPVDSVLYGEAAGHAQPIPLRKGCLVSWDSRTTHANSSNLSTLARYVMYVAAGPAREDDLTLVNTRKTAFETGEGSNVREALMHASKKPRFDGGGVLPALRKPEPFDLLGQLLYGLAPYGSL